MDQDPHMISCYFNHLFEGLISKHSHILRFWGLGLQHGDFGGHNWAQDNAHPWSEAHCRKSSPNPWWPEPSRLPARLIGSSSSEVTKPWALGATESMRTPNPGDEQSVSVLGQLTSSHL